MANQYGFPFNAVEQGGTYDREYNADDFATYFEKFMSNGVYAKNGDALEVIADSNSMNVTIKSGACFINGRSREWNDTQTIRLSNSNANYDRYDLIVARLSLIDRKISIEVIEGSASANPIVPNVTQTNDTYELLLAQVLVKTGVTSITQSDVTDKRSSSLCGFVSNILSGGDTYSKEEIDEMVGDVDIFLSTLVYGTNEQELIDDLNDILGV